MQASSASRQAPVHGVLLRPHRPDHEGPHEGRVVVAPGAGELEGELVARAEPAAPREVPAKERVASRADDELVARIVSAAPEHRPLHRGQDVAVERARNREAFGLREGVVGELRGPPDEFELGGALAQAKLRDEVRGVLEPAEAFERLLDPAPVRGRQAVGVELHPDPLSRRVVAGRRLPKLARRVAPRFVHPDADVLDDRRMARLAEVRGPGEEGHAPVPTEPQALEEAEPEGVVAREVVHALRLEHEEARETALLHRPAGRLASGRELLAGEMNRHAPSFKRSEVRRADGTPRLRRPPRPPPPPPRSGRRPRGRNGRAAPLR